MSTREMVLRYLERHRFRGYSVGDLKKHVRSSEPRIRKHIHDLVIENIIEARGTTPVYFGFVGFECEFLGRCDEVASECKAFAHRCVKRQRYLDGEEEEETS